MSKDTNVKIQIVGCDSDKLSAKVQQISQLSSFPVSSFQINPSEPDEFYDKTQTLPEILIFLLDDHSTNCLEHLSSIPQTQRPILIVIGEYSDSRFMRLSMRAGARDFLAEPADSHEIKACLQRLIIEQKQAHATSKGQLITVLNAKGGSGASLVACNLAHIATVATGESNVLIDMDLQFGAQSLLLDLRPEHTVVEALHDIQSLDFAAIEGYMTRHKSGLRLLSTLHEQVVLPGEVSVEALNKLLELSLDNYDNVFVDMPRSIDLLTATILDRSSHIIIVVQQTLAHMRDAKRLVKILKSDLVIAEKNIHIVINRYNSDSSLTAKDIQLTLECSNIFTIPNDYEKVATTTNLGVPLMDYAKKAPITQALIDLLAPLGIDIKDDYKRKGWFKRLFAKD